MSGYLYILATIFFTVYGQVVLKWRMPTFGPLPGPLKEKLIFMITAVFDPFIFSGLLGAFLASFCWMAVVTKFDLSFAYPFTVFSFVAVMLFSIFLFNEPLTWHKIAGTLLIVAGIIVSSQSLS